MVELKHPLLQVKYLLVEHLEIKGFDIPHPTKENYRLRHVCVEET